MFKDRLKVKLRNFIFPCIGKLTLVLMLVIGRFHLFTFMLVFSFNFASNALGEFIVPCLMIFSMLGRHLFLILLEYRVWNPLFDDVSTLSGFGICRYSSGSGFDLLWRGKNYGKK